VEQSEQEFEKEEAIVWRAEKKYDNIERSKCRLREEEWHLGGKQVTFEKMGKRKSKRSKA
jgi:hypothetical protein